MDLEAAAHGHCDLQPAPAPPDAGQCRGRHVWHDQPRRPRFPVARNRNRNRYRGEVKAEAVAVMRALVAAHATWLGMRYAF